MSDNGAELSRAFRQDLRIHIEQIHFGTKRQLSSDELSDLSERLLNAVETTIENTLADYDRDGEWPDVVHVYSDIQGSTVDVLNENIPIRRFERQER